MNADAVIRALETQGQIVTLKRLTGQKQVAFSVDCLAFVAVGEAELLVGNTQQTGDQIMLTDREMNAKKWPKPPRHGDQVVSADGATRTVQGRAMVYRLDDDIVYSLRTLGG